MRRLIYFILSLLFITGCNLKNIGSPDEIHAYELYNKALEYNLQLRNSEALLLYDSAIFLLPGKADFYTNRGFTKYVLKDTIGALSDYHKALGIDSLDATTHMNIGALFNDRGDYTLGLEYSQKALNLGDMYAFYNVGLAQYKLENYEAAIDAFLNFLKKYPVSRELSLYYLGYSYSNLGHIDKAQSCWSEANKLAGYDIIAEFDSQPENLSLGN